MASTFDIVPAITVAYGRLIGDGPDRSGEHGSANPLRVLWYWISQGAHRIHVEDLSADSTLPTIPALLLGCRAPIALGIGGIIHDAAAARAMASHGASPLVLHRVLYQPLLFQSILRTVDPNRLMLAIHIEDVDNPKIAARLDEAYGAGLRHVMLAGPWTAPKILPFQEDAICGLRSRGFAVWAAGGIRHVDTLKAMKELGLSGAFVGRSLNQGVLRWDHLQTLVQ